MNESVKKNHLHNFKRLLAFCLALALAACLMPGGLWRPVDARALSPSAEFEQKVQEHMDAGGTGFDVFVMAQDENLASGGGQTVLAYGLNNTGELPGDDYFITIDKGGSTLFTTKGSAWSYRTYGTWKYAYLTVSVPANNGSAEADHDFSIQVWSPDPVVVPLKSEPPVIGEIYTFDTAVYGTGIAGSEINVTFPDNTVRTTTVQPNSIWSVPVAGTLAEGDIVQATQTEVDKLESDPAYQVVIELVLERSDPPEIDEIFVGDTEVTGNGIAGAEVTVTFPSGTKTTVQVSYLDKWSVTVSGTLSVGDLVYAFQTEPGKAHSDEVDETVQERDLEKSAPPVIDDVYEDDTEVSGRGVVGALVTVSFPGGGQETDVVDGSGIWEVTSPVPLVEDDVIYAYQTEAGKANSDTVQTTVLPLLESALPTIDSIANRSTQATGTGIPGATVHVITPNTMTTAVLVDENGMWSLSYPARFATGQIVYAYQVEPGKKPSGTVLRVVGEANRIAYINMESTKQTFSHTSYIDMSLTRQFTTGLSAYLSQGDIGGLAPDVAGWQERGRDSVTVKVAAPTPQGPEPRIDSLTPDQNSLSHLGGAVELVIEGENLHLYTTLQIRSVDTNETENVEGSITSDNAQASTTFLLQPNDTSASITYVFEAVTENGVEATASVVVYPAVTPPGPEPSIDSLTPDQNSLSYQGGAVELVIEGENLHLYTTLQIRSNGTGITENVKGSVTAGNTQAAATFSLPANDTDANITYTFEAVTEKGVEATASVVVRPQGSDPEDPDPVDPDPEDPDPVDPDPVDPDPEDPDPVDPDPVDPDPEDPDPVDPDPVDPDPVDPDPEYPEEPGPGGEKEYRGGGSGGGFHGGGQYWRGPAIFDILEHQATMSVESYLSTWNEGGTPDAPTVAVENAGYLTAEQLLRAASGAREAKGNVRGPDVTLQLDTTMQTEAGLELQGRIFLNPEGISEGVYTGVYVQGEDVNRTKNIFTSRFGLSNTAVVSLQQREGFGQKLEIAANVDLTGLNTSNLHLYSYDPYTGEYQQLQGADAYVDTAGFLHFSTDQGGDIVVVDQPLGSASGQLNGVVLKKEEPRLDVKEPEEEPGKDLDFGSTED